MGSNTSKPETKVFTPTTPVDFSSTFLSQLEQSPEVRFQKELLLQHSILAVDQKKYLLLDQLLTPSLIVGLFTSSIY